MLVLELIVFLVGFIAGWASYRRISRGRFFGPVPKDEPPAAEQPAAASPK